MSNKAFIWDREVNLFGIKYVKFKLKKSWRKKLHQSVPLYTIISKKFDFTGKIHG